MPSFTLQELSLPGVFLIVPDMHFDERGFSVNVYNDALRISLKTNVSFVEDFTSYSKKDVIRGLHFQRPPHAQDKLVRCAKGRIFDVAADCDPNSPTYGRYVSAQLTGAEQSMLFIPGKYAHGFCVMSDDATVEYKLSDTYHPAFVEGARFDDTALGIDWPVTNPLISEQDASWPPLRI